MVRREIFDLENIPDPEYPNQWHLKHTFPGLSVEGAWKLGYTGKGVVVSIIDDGLDSSHPELQEAYASEYSYDVIRGKPEVELEPEDTHGTPAGGVVAARYNYNQTHLS